VNYLINILPRAESDFQQMYSYIQERSSEGAIRWRQAFDAGVDRLTHNPFIYDLAPEDKHFDFEMRQLLFKTRHGRTYRAVYRIDENVVVVLRICGPGQAPLSPDEMPLG